MCTLAKTDRSLFTTWSTGKECSWGRGKCQGLQGSWVERLVTYKRIDYIHISQMMGAMSYRWRERYNQGKEESQDEQCNLTN